MGFLLGDAWAPAGIAAVAGVIVLLNIRPLAAADRRAGVPVERVGQLSAVEALGLLGADALEMLARVAEDGCYGPGQTIISQGEIGHRYYVLTAGSVQIWRNDELLATLGPVSGFGEYALLRDTPRSATVVAVDDCVVLELEREDFLAAVLGSPSANAQISLVADRIHRSVTVPAHHT